MDAADISLAIVTPTRRRWQWLAQQAQRIAPQLHDNDRWIVVIDNDQAPQELMDAIIEIVGPERLICCLLSYLRPEPPVGCVNVAHNAGASLAPSEHAIVEIDDHDLIEPGALDAVRTALADGADYVFGWYKQEALITGPRGQRYIEPWPFVKPTYEHGAFRKGTMGDGGAGMRAIDRKLWNDLGGWDVSAWPSGDRQLAIRAEAEATRIVCIPQFLCTVLIDPDGISATYKGDLLGVAA